MTLSVGSLRRPLRRLSTLSCPLLLPLLARVGVTPRRWCAICLKLVWALFERAQLVVNLRCLRNAHLPSPSASGSGGGWPSFLVGADTVSTHTPVHSLATIRTPPLPRPVLLHLTPASVQARPDALGTSVATCGPSTFCSIESVEPTELVAVIGSLHSVSFSRRFTVITAFLLKDFALCHKFFTRWCVSLQRDVLHCLPSAEGGSLNSRRKRLWNAFDGGS